MEKKFFDWETWDQLDTCDLLFYRCVLQKRLDRFYPGDIISSIRMNYQEGEMTFYDEDGKDMVTIELELLVRE